MRTLHSNRLRMQETSLRECCPYSFFFISQLCTKHSQACYIFQAVRYNVPRLFKHSAYFTFRSFFRYYLSPLAKLWMPSFHRRISVQQIPKRWYISPASTSMSFGLASAKSNTCWQRMEARSYSFLFSLQWAMRSLHFTWTRSDIFLYLILNSQRYSSSSNSLFIFIYSTASFSLSSITNIDSWSLYRVIDSSFSMLYEYSDSAALGVGCNRVGGRQ